MPIVQFHKATNPNMPEAVLINTDAVLFVEVPPETQIGSTSIHVVGLHTDTIRITDPLVDVLSILPPLVSTYRHYHAGAPHEGATAVHIAPKNVSYILPNAAQNPAFWIIHFRDESELRVVHPLPANL